MCIWCVRKVYLKSGGKLIPNEVLQCYLIHIPAYWGKTQSLIALSQWTSMHWNQLCKLLFLKYYRECCRITNTEVLKQTSSLLVIFDLCFVDELCFSDSVGFKKIYITEIMHLNCCFWAQGTSHDNIIDEIVSQVPNWCGLCLFRAFLISTGLLEGNKERCLYSLHCTQCLGVLCYRHKPHVCQILLWM